MRVSEEKLMFQPDLENRKSFLLLRWLVIIVASYLTLFSDIESRNFSFIFVFVLAFALSNIVFSLLPPERFISDRIQRSIAIADGLFVSACLVLLRVEGIHLYIPLIGIFLLALVWRDLRLVLFALFVVSLLFGAFTYFRLLGSQSTIEIEKFLTLALFFVVSIFYVFLAERFKQDARLSKSLFEEKRNVETMLEITKVLSSSLKTDEILYSIVSRLREVAGAVECSIVRVDSSGSGGTVLAMSEDPKVRNVRVELGEYPELQEVYQSRQTLFIPDVLRHEREVSSRGFGPRLETHSVLAVPMIFQQTVLGMIYIRARHPTLHLSERTKQFLEVVASAAANALRNAQLFEEVEHLAKTDFLTGLPNHRFFQFTLSLELGRAERHGHSLSLLMIDLDYLKVVNDRFGHPMGDVVIRTVAERIRSTCREIDFAARYGGEEFMVILPETPLSGAISAAKRIREKISETEIPGVGTVTASIGISNYPVNAINKEDLIRVADQALYIAKNAGRDTTAHFDYKLISSLH